jgi:hypothetical protein
LNQETIRQDIQATFPDFGNFTIHQFDFLEFNGFVIDEFTNAESLHKRREIVDDSFINELSHIAFIKKIITAFFDWIFENGITDVFIFRKSQEFDVSIVGFVIYVF